MKKGKFTLKDWQRRRKLLVIQMFETKAVIGWFKLQLWMWLAYWTVRQQLGKWISGKQFFLKPITIEEIVIFMISDVITLN